jgi:hypothetical protein
MFVTQPTWWNGQEYRPIDEFGINFGRFMKWGISQMRCNIDARSQPSRISLPKSLKYLYQSGRLSFLICTVQQILQRPHQRRTITAIMSRAWERWTRIFTILVGKPEGQRLLEDIKAYSRNTVWVCRMKSFRNLAQWRVLVDIQIDFRVYKMREFLDQLCDHQLLK